MRCAPLSPKTVGSTPLQSRVAVVASAGAPRCAVSPPLPLATRFSARPPTGPAVPATAPARNDHPSLPLPPPPRSNWNDTDPAAYKQHAEAAGLQEPHQLTDAEARARWEAEARAEEQRQLEAIQIEEANLAAVADDLQELFRSYADPDATELTSSGGAAEAWAESWSISDDLQGVSEDIRSIIPSVLDGPCRAAESAAGAAARAREGSGAGAGAGAEEQARREWAEAARRKAEIERAGAEARRRDEEEQERERARVAAAMEENRVRMEQAAREEQEEGERQRAEADAARAAAATASMEAEMRRARAESDARREEQEREAEEERRRAAAEDEERRRRNREAARREAEWLRQTAEEAARKKAEAQSLLSSISDDLRDVTGDLRGAVDVVRSASPVFEGIGDVDFFAGVRPVIEGTELAPSELGRLRGEGGLVSVVGFGSLLSERSARTTFPHLQNFREARLRGWRRVFAHVAPIFFERGIANAATREMSSLSVEPSDDPAAEIVVSQFEVSMTDEELDRFVEREHEFRFVAVRCVDATGRPDGRLAVVCARYSDEEYRRERCPPDEFQRRYGRHGVDVIWRDDVLPCAVYCRHCVLASQKLSAAAHDSFLDATFLADRRTPLRQYLRDNPHVMDTLPPESLAGRYSG